VGEHLAHGGGARVGGGEAVELALEAGACGGLRDVVDGEGALGRGGSGTCGGGAVGTRPADGVDGRGAPRYRHDRDHRRDGPPGQLHHAGMIADRVRQVVDLAPNV
jgi:hypothetical protein